MKEKTLENLKAAFAGESQANRRYLAFATKADEEGFSQAAKLFRAAAESETVHALKHLAAMGTVGQTSENLGAAINGETFEFQELYPDMIKTAKEDDEKAAWISFMNANTVEQEHAALFKELLGNLEGAKPVTYYVCQNCGHVHINEMPDKCPVCGWSHKFFTKID